MNPKTKEKKRFHALDDTRVSILKISMFQSHDSCPIRRSVVVFSSFINLTKRDMYDSSS